MSLTKIESTFFIKYSTFHIKYSPEGPFSIMENEYKSIAVLKSCSYLKSNDYPPIRPLSESLRSQWAQKQVTILYLIIDLTRNTTPITTRKISRSLNQSREATRIQPKIKSTPSVKRSINTSSDSIFHETMDMIKEFEDKLELKKTIDSFKSRN